MTPRERIARALAQRDDRHIRVWDDLHPGDREEYLLDADAALAALTSDDAVQEWAGVLADEWEREADEHTADEEFGIAEGLRIAARSLRAALGEAGACERCGGRPPRPGNWWHTCPAEALREHLTGGAS